jgi:hypothetical protein
MQAFAKWKARGTVVQLMIANKTGRPWKWESTVETGNNQYLGSRAQSHCTYFLIRDWPWLSYLGHETDFCSIDYSWLLNTEKQCNLSTGETNFDIIDTSRLHPLFRYRFLFRKDTTHAVLCMDMISIKNYAFSRWFEAPFGNIRSYLPVQFCTLLQVPVRLYLDRFTASLHLQ